MSTVRIVSAVLNTTALKLYREDGHGYFILQGRKDLPDLLALCQLYLTGPGSYFDIEETLLSDVSHNPAYVNLAPALQRISVKSNGMIRFFRMARSKAASLFRMADQTDGTFIRLDTESGKTSSAPVNQTQLARVAEVLAQAKEVELEKPINVVKETIVAVTDEGAMIGVEALEAQMTQGEEEGVAALIQRMANIKWEHTAQDVLSFIKRADLPLTRDGMIIAYKNLYTRSNGFVDCHSQTVYQEVGDLVQMPHARVDRDRHRDCSVGLHVARRQYLQGFCGDTTVIILLAPEDVVAVPHRHPDKVRVASYQIIHRLSHEGVQQVRRDQALDPKIHTQDWEVIQKLVAGWRPSVTADVFVNGPAKEDVKRVLREQLSPVSEPAKVAPVVPVDASGVINAAAAVGTNALKLNEADKVAPSSVRSMALKGKEEAQRLWGLWKADPSQTNAVALLTFKKTAKVSWERLGLDPKDVPSALATSAQIKAAAAPATTALTPRAQLAALQPIITKDRAMKALAIKKAAKKGWEALGVLPAQGKVIEQLAK